MRGGGSTFRPAVSLSDDAADQLEYELTTLPPRQTLAWSLFGLAAAIAYSAAQYRAPFDLEEEPLSFTLGLVLGAASFVGFGVLFYHTIHQLRLIGRLQGYVERIDLLNLAPLHGFAGVTATTGAIRRSRAT